jgi:hypothetical protein
MTSTEAPGSVSKLARWGGYIMCAPPIFMLLMSAFMKLSKSAAVMEGMPHMGYPAWQAVPIGAVELLSTVLYLIPQTSVLGAILLTGYLGGAVATHVRVEEWAFANAVVFGILLWGSLYLRDPRIRALIPLRRKPSDSGNTAA